MTQTRRNKGKKAGMESILQKREIETAGVQFTSCNISIGTFRLISFLSLCGLSYQLFQNTESEMTKSIPEFVASSPSSYFSDLKTYLHTHYKPKTFPTGTYFGQMSEAGYDLHGLGHMIMDNSQEYIGDVVMSEFRGFEKMTYANGDCREGQWERNEANGFGTARSLMHNVVYTGMFQNNQKHGHGEYSDDHQAYVGEWQHDQKHGHGTWHDKIAETNYTGEFKDNVRHGTGTVVAGNYTYTGGFKVDVKHGQGHYQYREVGYEYDYTGMFKNDKKHGWGYMNNIAAGYEFEGHFWQGTTTFIGRVRHSNGKVDNNCVELKADYVLEVDGNPLNTAGRSLKCKEFQVILM